MKYEELKEKKNQSIKVVKEFYESLFKSLDNKEIDDVQALGLVATFASEMQKIADVIQ